MYQLKTINEMLLAIGDQPIITLNTEQLWPEAENAKNLLEAERIALLNRGWWFNTIKIDLIPRLDTKEVTIPADALQVHFPEDRGNYLVRGKRVYNKETNSYKHDSKIVSRIFQDISYEDMPKSFQHYLKVVAVRKFQTLREGALGENEYSQKDELDAISHLQNEHYRNSKVNFIHGTDLYKSRMRYRY